MKFPRLITSGTSTRITSWICDRHSGNWFASGVLFWERLVICFWQRWVCPLHALTVLIAWWERYPACTKSRTRSSSRGTFVRTSPELGVILGKIDGGHWHQMADERISDPPSKEQPGACNGQRQGWKIPPLPAGPPDGAVILCVQIWCSVWQFPWLSSEFCSLSYPKFFESVVSVLGIL